MSTQPRTRPARPARSAATTRLVLLVATRKGAWLLHGDGRRKAWTVDGPHFLGHVVSHLVLDPRDGRTLLAAARTGHLGPTVFRSTNMGRSWKEAARPPAFCAWAMAVMQRAVRALEAEHEAAGKKAQFEALQGWLGGAGADCSQSEAARRLGMSEGAVKVAVHRLRKRLRELIRAEIEQTVPDAAGVDEELRYLIEVLGRAGS